MINRFRVSSNKIRYLYNLTPQGIEEKASLTVNFLKRKMSEYNQIKRQIRELVQEVQDEGLGDTVDDEALKEANRVL